MGGRNLCFGGSFNPIHCGHLICARAAAEQAGFDRVVLIPSAQPPHKPQATDLADATDRLAMCRLACTAPFEVDDIELGRAGPSYTIDTARQLAAREGVKTAWLIGADMLALLPKWHQPEALLAEVDFVIMARPGWQFDWDALPRAFGVLKANVVTAPLIEIGATDLRRRVRQGLPIDYLTPPAVVEYIQARGLYRV